MRTVTAADANRQFSSVLREVSQGETFTVVSRGRPVATISPASADHAQRSAAKISLLARLRTQRRTGARDWSRDELYE
ncbi:type II toxin-antitoxin system Phd/YefM family antitoxin [Acidithiobacillus sp.]